MIKTNEDKSWREKVIAYQIYPRSFKDSNNDGIGDIKGIIEKLDYLKELGIDLIWVCPFYKSPNADNGYDISDYKDIMDEFGTMEDCDNLLKEVHKRGMKLIIDLVINHTSDEHPWFIEAINNKNSNKRDWYIFKEGKEDKEPNNWESIFKGSAWEKDIITEEYFLHLFDKKQPDLNWENKEVRDALYEMINWWLDKGIDGFRIDAISHIKKDLAFSDMPNPNNHDYVSCFEKMMNYEGIDEFLQELKDNTFSKYDILTVGEANGVKAEEAYKWTGKEGYFNMIFQFEHLNLWDRNGDEVNVVALKKTLSKWQYELENKGWNALYLENHDLPRVVSMWGDEENYWEKSAKAYALMYFMQKGTPFIYQGQEIGMTNVHVDEIEEYKEMPTIITYYENIEKGMSKEEALKVAYNTTRANSRTPMQWDNSINAGFSEFTPWMKVNENYTEINVEKQLKDRNSILNFYKKMIEIRKNNEELVYGTYNLLCEEDKNIYAYERIDANCKFIIIVNLSSNEVSYRSDEILDSSNLLISSYDIKEEKSNIINLKPYEGRMYRINLQKSV